MTIVSSGNGSANGNGNGNGNGKRLKRMNTTVSSHMVNYPVGLQTARPEHTRQSLLTSCPACRARM